MAPEAPSTGSVDSGWVARCTTLAASAPAMYSTKNPSRVNRASIAGPKIHRNHMLLIRCSQPPCMKALVKSGHQFDGSSPAALASSGSV